MSVLMDKYKEERRDIFEWMYDKKMSKESIRTDLGMGRDKINNILDGRSTIPEFMEVHDYCKNYISKS